MHRYGGEKGTADLSTPLRSGRDDNSFLRSDSVFPGETTRTSCATNLSSRPERRGVVVRQCGPGKEIMAIHNESAALTRPSRGLLSFFARYLHWYIGRHFHGIRLANSSRFPVTTSPLIIFANHASWWDPLAFIVVSRRFLPHASHYGPMDAVALKHYSFLRKLGLFPVESGTRRGAIQFLRVAQQILSTPNSVLWVTPEGCFTDVRRRPAVFRPGLASLVDRLDTCTLVPLAFEYTFWDERLPEILVSCGQPIAVADHPAGEWNERLCTALVAAQDELAALAKLRDPARFETILSGRVGMTGVYEAWKRLVALLTGRVYEGSHGSIHRS
jgi:1-acyl-sn-glycerol-3-phosphate acyltransferase